MITGRHAVAGAGTQNASIAWVEITWMLNVSTTEEYNGTSWAAGGAL
jgi:hypothetical protein